MAVRNNKLHTYIIGDYNPSVRIIGLVSQSTNYKLFWLKYIFKWNKMLSVVTVSSSEDEEEYTTAALNSMRGS